MLFELYPALDAFLLSMPGKAGEADFSTARTEFRG